MLTLGKLISIRRKLSNIRDSYPEGNYIRSQLINVIRDIEKWEKKRIGASAGVSTNIGEENEDVVYSGDEEDSDEEDSDDGDGAGQHNNWGEASFYVPSVVPSDSDDDVVGPSVGTGSSFVVPSVGTGPSIVVPSVRTRFSFGVPSTGTNPISGSGYGSDSDDDVVGPSFGVPSVGTGPSFGVPSVGTGPSFGVPSVPSPRRTVFAPDPSLTATAATSAGASIGAGAGAGASIGAAAGASIGATAGASIGAGSIRNSLQRLGLNRDVINRIAPSLISRFDDEKKSPNPENLFRSREVHQQALIASTELLGNYHTTEEIRSMLGSINDLRRTFPDNTELNRIADILFNELCDLC